MSLLHRPSRLLRLRAACRSAQQLCSALFTLPLLVPILLAAVTLHLPLSRATVSVASALSLPAVDPPMCAMYGHCNNFTNSGDGIFLPIDCPTPAPAQHPTFNLTECPYLQNEYVCCDELQYAEFADGFAYLKNFLSQCRACVENFRTYLCATTCGSGQARYTSVLGTTVEQRIDVRGRPIVNSTTTVVNATSVSLSLSLVEALYDSCKGVKNPSTGLPIVSFLGNGLIVDARSFMSTIISGGAGKNSPVYNEFHYTDDDNTALTLNNIGRPMYSCANQSSGLGCSCNDCPEGCNRCPTPTHYNDSALVPDGAWPAFGHNYLDPVSYGAAVGFLCYVGVVLLAGLGAQWGGGGWRLVARSSVKARRVVWWSGVVVLAVLVVYVVSLLWMALTERVAVLRGDEAGQVYALSSWLHPAYFVFLLASLIGLVVAIWFFVWRYLQAHPYTFRYEPLAHGASATGDAEDEEVLDDSGRSSFLSRYAAFVASYPWVVIGAAVLFTAVCSLGVLKARLESDPIALWVSPDSQVLKDKEYFDATFGPFYRTEQLIFTPSTTTASSSPSAQLSDSASAVLTRRSMLMLQQLTDTIRSLTVSFNGSDVTLSHTLLPTHPRPGVRSGERARILQSHQRHTLHAARTVAQRLAHRRRGRAVGVRVRQSVRQHGVPRQHWRAHLPLGGAGRLQWQRVRHGYGADCYVPVE